LIGIYVHVPFCLAKCRYCDFYSRPPREGERDAYVEALAREAAMRCASGPDVQTVYFGGGTPSVLGGDRIAAILDALRERCRLAGDAEVTVEANPGDATEAWARRCLEAGFNRISLGVQSVDAADLAFLGRRHGVEDGPRAARAAREAGFTNIGIDLIYGLPGQQPDAWEQRMVAAAERCRPDHVSCYQLTYAEKTPLGADLAAGRVRRLREDEEHALFLLTHRVMPQLGFPAYEVSNFAQPSRRSRHNTRYWQGKPYVGLGPAAHSYDPPVRSWNVAEIDAYLEAVAAGRLPVGGSETLSGEQMASETLMLSLRTTDGIDRPAFRARFGYDVAERHPEAVSQARSRGLLVVDDVRIRPTLAGLAVADRLAVELA
jgi:oxygen-independent coproporphyrinogen-3 oxidase